MQVISAAVGRVLVFYWQFKNSGLPFGGAPSRAGLHVTAAVMETNNGTTIITFTGISKIILK